MSRVQKGALLGVGVLVVGLTGARFVMGGFGGEHATVNIAYLPVT